jgi:hypothetical protein
MMHQEARSQPGFLHLMVVSGRISEAFLRYFRCVPRHSKLQDKKFISEYI